MRILLVNRHMNIGGVETYLYRLCAGLKARGHDVGLLTEGGLYEDKVTAAGATLHKVKSLARDWPAEAAKLQAYGYQLVHAHNYHSARVGQALAKTLRVPYLMSVHGPRPRLKQLLFRDWSKPVVVMSEGDRTNIAWWGGVSAKDIELSFYGIDTDRFHSGIDTAALRTELGLAPNATVLVFISRFSNRKADVGHALLDALPSLRTAHPQLQLLLVGEGPESGALEKHIQSLNTKTSSAIARMIGPRRDVERFMALATIAVCTANTALEAMACGAPTIAAGRTGYFGLVTPENFEAARALCFADHGTSPATNSAAAFVQEVNAVLADRTASARAADNAALIRSHYSVEYMVADLEKIYQRLLEGTP
jgi:glycosyltransferase involved in cell wall biosynthesis